MKNYVYYMHADARSPVSETMTLEEWFREYKWMVEGDVFVPAPFTNVVERIATGDRLWFALYELVVGHVLVIRSEPYHIGGFHELWYDGASCQLAATTARYVLRPDFNDEVAYDFLMAKHFGVFETTEEAASSWLQG